MPYGLGVVYRRDQSLTLRRSNRVRMKAVMCANYSTLTVITQVVACQMFLHWSPTPRCTEILQDNANDSIMLRRCAIFLATPYQTEPLRLFRRRFFREWLIFPKVTILT